MIIFGNMETFLQLPPMTFTNVYNLSTPLEYGRRLYNLPPYCLDIFAPDFDFAYANYILSNQAAFMEMMELVLNVYYGTNAYVLVGEEFGYKIEISESLIKFLQQRYGIIVYTVRSLEDLYCIGEEVSLSDYGLMNLDIDRERYYHSLPESVIKELDNQCICMEAMITNG